MKKWLNDLRNDQSESGEIPHVAPDVLGDKHTDAMWCDTITMTPWSLYKIYGDLSFLSDNYEAMKLFVSAREKTMKDGIICGGRTAVLRHRDRAGNCAVFRYCAQKA